MRDSRVDERRRTYKVKIAEAIGAAFGTFSRIPVPKSAWTDFGSTHALAAFPLVGLAEGFLMTAWGHMANLLGVHRVTLNKALRELELAYAITVHKAQGSEYPAVVIPLLSGPRPLMNRNLLYTAVTRARSCVTLVGSAATFQAMIENGTEQKRYTGLCETIKSYISSQMSDM